MKKKTTLNPVNSSLPDPVGPDSCTEAIISMNESLTIRSWNSAAERVYGIGRNEVMGKNLTDVIGYGFIENSLFTFCAQLAATGYWQGEVMHIRNDRAIIFSLVSVSAVKDPLECVIGYVAIVREEAMTPSAQKRFKPVFDSEYRFVGLVDVDSPKAWQMVLHWQE